MAGIEPSGQQRSEPRLVLLPKNSAEAITFMLKAFGEFPDETRLAMYLTILEGCGTDEVYEAVKDWSRRPHDRSAKGGELLEIIHTKRAAHEQREAQARQQRDATIPPTSARDLDAIYEKLKVEHPENQLLHERIVERERLKALGKTLDGRAEVSALLGVLMSGKEIENA